MQGSVGIRCGGKEIPSHYHTYQYYIVVDGNVCVYVRECMCVCEGMCVCM